MRDSRSLAKRRRQLRRATLAVALLASTSVVADQPHNATLRMLPPLPLKTIASNDQIQSNPFCQTPHQQTGVRLASGTASEPVRLKPVGTAIGLQQISPASQASASILVDAPTESGIRSNPMVAHTASNTFAEAPLEQASSAATETTIRLVRPNTQLPMPAVQQAAIPTNQAVNVAPTMTSNRGDGSAPGAHVAVIPPFAAPSQTAVPSTSGHGPAAKPEELKADDILSKTNDALAKTDDTLAKTDDTLANPEVQPTAAVEKSNSVAAMLKSNPDPRTSALVEESEPIFFSFSDDSETSAPEADAEADDKVESSDTPGDEESRRRAPASATVTIAQPISVLPQVAPRSVLQKVEPTTEESAGGFAAVKIAQPNIRAVVNPFVNEEASAESDRNVEPKLDDIETDQLASQELAGDDQISVLEFNPPVILAEAPGMSGELVDPIQLDDEPIRTVPEAGSSILATSEEDSPSLSVLTPMQDVMTTESGESIAIDRSEPAVAKRDPQNDETLRSKRYRPPVAVKQVPIAFERQELQTAEPSIVQSAVQPIARTAAAEPVAEMKVDNLGIELGPETKLTPLHMNQAQVRSLTLGGSVTKVRVGDKDICQAFASGPNQLKLIGTGPGVTRLVVWAAPDGEDQKTLMRAFEIHVGDVAPTEGEPVADTVHLLNSSIDRAFPNCRANVQLIRGELHVVGKCDNQESAKKIIRMVRKSCLIPVRDQLSVQ